MNNPKVSVILTVYNTSRYLNKCLDSIISQTLKEIEIICINDGSTDNSLDILSNYAEIDSRIEVLCSKNIGAGAARNIGLKQARGEYLSILDSDDFFELDMLEKSYEVASNNSLDFVVFRSRYYNDQTKEIGSLSNIKYSTNSSIFSKDDIEKDIFGTFVGWAWDKLYSRDFVDSNEIYFQEIKSSNDLLFVYKAFLLAEKISIIDDELVYHRIANIDSVSNSRGDSWKCFYYALKELKQFLHASGMYNKYEQDFVNYCLHFSLWNLKSVDKMYKETYKLLKHTIFKEFGILDKKGHFLYNRVDRIDRFIIRYSNLFMFSVATKAKSIIRLFKKFIRISN